MKINTLSRQVLIAAAAGMMLLSAFGFIIQRAALSALQELAKENLPWTVTQLELELHRLIERITRMEAGDPSVKQKDIAKRFDILWSRASLYDRSGLGARLAPYDADLGAMAALHATLRENDETVARLTPDQAAELTALRIAFGYHETRLRKLTAFVNAGEARRRSDIRARLWRGQIMSAGLGLGAAALIIALIVLVMSEARRNHQQAEANAALAREAAGANAAKTRFLSMMSHELRTPMNGVLGQLALAKAPGLPPPQLKLIEQAERSGRRLISMLLDILDFSALQENQLDLSPEPFEISHLARAFGAYGAGDPGDPRAPLAVECADRLPRAVTGDLRRTRQAIAHLVGYISDIACVRNLRLLIDHGDGELRLTLSFLYEDRDAAGLWRPDLLLGATGRADGHFETEALGPAIARALIQALGGRIELTGLYQGQTSITVFLPAEEADEPRPRVRLETASATMKLICEAALRGADVDLAPEGAEDAMVDIALMEPGGEDEARQVSDLKRAHPGARIIALGVPQAPEAFDDIAKLPLEVNALRNVLHKRSA